MEEKNTIGDGDTTALYTVLTAYTVYTAQCVLCKVYFSAQPNKLRPILKFEKYYPIQQHIFVPTCLSARKIHFLKF